MERGVLMKDTHGSTVRFGPPLVITDDEIGFAIEQLGEALRALA
jgi:4-aminobutyrate aminotransferase-like enzyme